MDAKEEVRARLNIEDVVSEYVQLKRAGRNFKGLSPFTSEKTPSFIVSPEKHIWHDFSSGKGGDVFSFVMEVEGIDFRAALEQLARRAGVDLSLYDTAASGEVAKKKMRLLEAHKLATDYYQHTLVKNKSAMGYVFKKRGMDKTVFHEFLLGYAPDSGDALTKYLAKKGFTTKELGDAGLTNRYGGDLFRGRMMVPLMDHAGQVVGFTGRILEDDPKAPKYLNTPATLIYDKSRHVFGLSQAKEAIRKADAVVIVEGNLDVVSSHQAGIKNVVATAGTALTEGHLKALSRLTMNVKLAFDGDAAGLAATERAIPIAQAVGVELSIVNLPKNVKDPDELVKNDPSLWQKAIDTSEAVVDWVLGQYSKREDINTAAGKRRFSSASLGVIRNLKDAVEREHYLRKVALLTNTSLGALVAKLHDGAADQTAKPKKQIHQSDTTKQQAPNFNTRQDSLLAVLLLTPMSRQLLTETTMALLEGEARQALATYLSKYNTQLTEKLPKGLQPYETYVRIVELKAETRYADWTESDRTLEAARLLRQMEVEQKKRIKETLVTKLRDAEESGDNDNATRFREQLHKLIKEMARG